MAKTPDIVNEVRAASARRRLYLPHAIRQMARPDRMISASEVRTVIELGELVEDYPEDPRGHSCLMLGFGANERPIHVVCCAKDDYLAIITAYVPDADKWTKDFRREGQMMKCVHCQGEMLKGTAPLHVDRKGCHVLLDTCPGVGLPTVRRGLL